MINIAIDGPAGAGKSTIARGTAAALGYIYVDTGALYRAIGLYALRQGADCKDSEQVSSLLPGISLSIEYRNGTQTVLLNGIDVSEDIRTPEASMAASNVSAIPSVRDFLLETQRKIARENNVIMDGRDIGTVVLPDAQIKIFLTASPEERASRRFKELCEKDPSTKFDDVLADIILRDKQDSTRKIAPLVPAADSVIFDTTGKTLDESVALMLELISKKLDL